MTATETLFAFHNLRITRDGASLWIERYDGSPLEKGEAEVIRCYFHNPNPDPESTMIAAGSREFLDGVDSILKVVVCSS